MAFSIAGMVTMNGVLHLVIYPFLASQMGAESFGTALSLLSVVSVVSVSFGSGANYARILREGRGNNPPIENDFFLVLLMVAGGCIPVAIVSLIFSRDLSTFTFLSLLALLVASLLRNYLDVYFKIGIRFAWFFLYYVLVSVGYLIGLWLFHDKSNWMLCLLVGEVAACIFAACQFPFVRRPSFRPTPGFRPVLKSVMLLSSTTLIVVFLVNFDRILVLKLIGGTAVTVFYLSTISGKLMGLISAPFNGVVISHLTRYGKMPSRMNLVKGFAAMLVVAGGMVVVCTIISLYFVKMFYPAMFSMCRPYFWLGNAGQVLFFMSGILVMYNLRYGGEQTQVYTNTLYAFAYVGFALVGGLKYGLSGIIYAVSAANLLRFLIVVGIGVRISSRG